MVQRSRVQIPVAPLAESSSGVHRDCEVSSFSNVAPGAIEMLMIVGDVYCQLLFLALSSSYCN